MDVEQDEYWSIQLENDFFARSGDRYYTHGTEVSRTVMGEPPQWLEDIATLFPAFESDGVINIAGSGMCNGGRIKHHFKHNIWRKDCHIII